MKCLPAKCQKMLMGTTTFIQVLRTICLALKSLVPGAVAELGQPKDKGSCRSQGYGGNRFNNKKEQDTRTLSLSSW